MKKTGIAVLSIFIGVAAFVVTSIWAGELSETLQKYQHAVDTWDRTNQATLQSSTVLGNVPQGRDSLDQMSRLLDTEMGALGDLFRDGITFGKMPEMFGKLIDEGKNLDEAAKKVVAHEDAVLVGGKMKKLIMSASVLGNSIEIFTQEESEKLDKRRTFVKYMGYVLGILAIIVAGVASFR